MWINYIPLSNHTAIISKSNETYNSHGQVCFLTWILLNTIFIIMEKKNCFKNSLVRYTTQYWIWKCMYMKMLRCAILSPNLTYILAMMRSLNKNLFKTIHLLYYFDIKQKLILPFYNINNWRKRISLKLFTGTKKVFK